MTARSTSLLLATLLLPGLLAASLFAQDAKRAPLAPKVGRVVEVEAEVRRVETSITTDVDEGITYRTRDVVTTSERVVYLDRLEALRPEGGALRRTHYVLEGRSTTREEAQDEEDGKKLPPEAPVETKAESKLVGRHIRQQWTKDEITLDEGEPKLELWDMDPSLFVFDLERYFPKDPPKDGKLSGKEFLQLEPAAAFPGWPRALAGDALAEVVGTVAAYGKQSLKSVRWGARATSPAKGKGPAKGQGPSITYRVHLEVRAAGKDVSESLTAEWSARFALRKPSKAFPEPGGSPPK